MPYLRVRRFNISEDLGNIGGKFSDGDSFVNALARMLFEGFEKAIAR